MSGNIKAIIDYTESGSGKSAGAPINTVYLAGKITGDPQYRPKFQAAARELEEAGFIVCNPSTLPPTGFDYSAYIRMSSAMLIECDAVCFLGDWLDSEGAKLERTLAEKHRKYVFLYEDWLQRRHVIKGAGAGAAQERRQNEKPNNTNIPCL